MRTALIIASTVAVACFAGCVWLVATFHVYERFGAQRRQTFLVGGMDSGSLYLTLASLGAVSLIVIVTIRIRAAGRIHKAATRRIRLAALIALLVVGTPAAAFHLLRSALNADGVYSQVKGATVNRDLVVREWSFLFAGGGDVFERDGMMLTLVATTGTNDGYTPFADGEYSAVQIDEVVALRWPFDFGDPINTGVVIGDPALGPADTYDGIFHYEFK